MVNGFGRERAFHIRHFRSSRLKVGIACGFVGVGWATEGEGYIKWQLWSETG